MGSGGHLAQAVAAALTFGVAALAAVYAKGQVGEARRLRLEQAQPYVTASLEPAEGQIAELVIRNEGKTPAYNVRFHIDPEYRPANTALRDFTNSKLWREGFPSMVPGQSIRLLIDTCPARANNLDLPRSYDVTVEFEDHDGKPLGPLRYVADFEVFFGYNHLNLKTIDDIAQQLGELGRITARLNQIGVALTAMADAVPPSRGPVRPTPPRRRPDDRGARGTQPRVAGTRRRPPRGGAPLKTNAGLVASLPMEPLPPAPPETDA
jgi:hypothetical protein